MFRKKGEELQVPKPEVRQEETAYEDSWYRSLKAMREQQQETEPEVDEEVEAVVEPELEADEGSPETPDDALPEELQVRAGQLLERLRTLQHLADEPESEGEPEQKHSVWG